MDTPQTYAAVLALAEMPYSSKNQKLTSIAGQILSARLIKIVREDEGAVYSISASGVMSRMYIVAVGILDRIHIHGIMAR